MITIKAKYNLSDKDREFITELVSEEARKVIEPYSFILHDIVESSSSSKVIIEGTKSALENLLAVLKDNFPCDVDYKNWG